MRLEFNSLVKKLYSGNIDKEEFLKQYFKERILSENYIQHLIKQAISSKDDSLVEEAMVLLYTSHFKPESFSLLLCQLLTENWHTKHEDIAMLLKQVKSPETVNCLYNAAELRFDYLDYDDTCQFARKCIKALSTIENKNAIEKLKLLANSKNHVIAEYAKKELRYKSML